MVSRIDGGMLDPSTMWQNLLNKADQNKDDSKAVAPSDNKGSSVDDLFKQIDTNGDGHIDEEESKAALKKMHRHRHHGMPDPAELFKEADKDGDGKVSLNEFKAMMPPDGSGPDAEALFKRFDTNGDGYIDQSETEAAIKEMAQRNSPLAPQQDSFSALA